MPTSNYMPDVVVEVAFGSGYATPAASRVWTDVSAYVELDRLIGIIFARQDELSAADANILTLTLDNRDGRFTPNLASSPYYPNVKLFTPIRVTATPPGGSASTRYVGYVTDWPREWNGTDVMAYARIKAVSRLSRTGVTRKLRSMVAQETRDAAPAVYYELGEGDGSTSAANGSRTTTEPLKVMRPVGSSAAPTVAFGAATGPAGDGQPAPTFNGTGCLAVTFATPFSSIRSVSAFVLAASPPASLQDWLVPGGTEIFFFDSSGHIQVTWAGSPLLTTPLSYADGRWHHVATVLDGSNNVSLYVDGVVVASDTGSSPAFCKWLAVGGNPFFESTSGFTGSIAHVGLFPTALTAQQIADIYALGMATLTETTPARLTRLARWGGIASSEVNAAGAIVVGQQGTSGKSLTDAMREVEASEAGVLYDERDGTLTLKSRSDRYSATVGLTLNMALQQVGQDYNPNFDPAYLINDVTGTGPTGTARVADETSIDAYGDADKTVETIATDDDEPNALAGWLVNKYAQPRDRVPNLTVDVLNCGVSQNTVAAVTVGTRVQVTNRPSQESSATGDYFVEGYTETFGPESWVITFNVSDSGPWLGTWQLDSATRSQLGTTTILAL